MRPPTLNIFPSQPMHVDPSNNSKVYILPSLDVYNQSPAVAGVVKPSISLLLIS